MPSASNKIAGGWDGGKLLKGSMVKGAEVKIRLLSVVEAPEEWNSPLVAHIEPTLECGGFALNRTNIKKLAELIDDDYDFWGGHDVTLKKVAVTNPSTNKDAWGLEVVSASKRKPKKGEPDWVR